MGERGHGRRDYPPIEDYALIGDCRTGALVSKSGSIDWLCLPMFTSDPVFCALLDQNKGGRFRIGPSAEYRTERAYEDETNVLRTEFVTASGRVRLTDTMTVDESGDGELEPQREVLRIVEGLEGEVAIDVEFCARFCFGKHAPKLRRKGRLGWRAAYGAEAFYLQTELPLERAEGGTCLYGTQKVRAGDRFFLSLAYATGDMVTIPPLGEMAEARLRVTRDWWRKWAGQCAYDGDYRAAVIRSALTLKLLTYALSGAVFAAATTSLPEEIGGERNWDYRYCWLRDASLTLRAFMDMGYQAEAESFLEWLLHSTRLTRPDLSILYDAYGRTYLAESTLDHLEGYKGSRPVRTGNDAKDQLQLDTYGAVIDAAFEYAEAGNALDLDERRMLTDFGKTVCRIWPRKENGIWEIRGDRRHFTLGKIMAWVALDRLVRLAKDGRLKAPVAMFERNMRMLEDAIETYGYDEDLEAYTASFDSRDADAALFLAGRYGYLRPDDPRMEKTVDFIRRNLSVGPLIKRYLHGDGLSGDEGAFGICCFWHVEQLARAGRLDEARDLLGELCGFSNDVGLYAEQIDPKTGAALGNFPQAFTHVGLINAALAIRRAEKHGGRAGSELEPEPVS